MLLIILKVHQRLLPADNAYTGIPIWSGPSVEPLDFQLRPDGILAGVFEDFLNVLFVKQVDDGEVPQEVLLDNGSILEKLICMKTRDL